jgi:hypothetical protein
VSNKKVFFATTLHEPESQKILEALLTGLPHKYDVVGQQKEADFIIVDLVNLPMGCLNIEDRDIDGVPIRPQDPIPLFFFEPDGTKGDPTLRKLFLDEAKKYIHTEPRISKSIKQLRDDLEWLRAMLPFYKKADYVDASVANSVLDVLATVARKLEKRGV